MYSYEITSINPNLGLIYYNRWADGKMIDSGKAYNQQMPNPRWTKNSTIAKSMNIPMKDPSQPGIISITTIPSGAQVTLNNVKMALNTPINLKSVPVGSYNIKINLPGYNTYSTNVNVTTGSTTNIKYTMIKTPISVPVNPTPTPMPPTQTSSTTSLPDPLGIIAQINTILKSLNLPILIN